MILYDHASSGNCMKCRILLRHLGIAYESVTVDLFLGETRTSEHFARNPDGRIPVLELDSGETIPESGAILLYLAEGTSYLPADPLVRARVMQWMFFEQNQVEANLAVARFMRQAGRDSEQPEVFQDRLFRGIGSLATLDRGLSDGRAFVAGDEYTVADIALYAYVHAGADADASADPRGFAGVSAWLDRVEAQPGFVNDLEDVPEHISQRPPV
jgi:glutathione S-transferase